MSFIVNRREKLRANDLPPEIPDTSELVKKTDKATASKLGLVKIGDNVNVSSGGAISVPVGSSETFGVLKAGEGVTVTNGVISVASGGGIDLLYTAPDTPVAASTEITLSAPVSDYKFIIAVISTDDNSVTGTLVFSAEIAPYCAFGALYGGQGSLVKFSVNGAKIKQTAGLNTHNYWARVYGLK